MGAHFERPYQILFFGELYMDSVKTRKEQALDACDKVINGIEDGTITTSSALLLCKKIARLVNDEDGQEWLDYEYNGYPECKESGKILASAYKVACQHGRSFIKQNSDIKKFEEYIFVDVASELEQSVESLKASINNLTTNGFSVSGDFAVAATNSMTDAVRKNNSNLISLIMDQEKKISILRSQYYDFAVKWQIQLNFGIATKSIFDEYQERVDVFCNFLPVSTLRKFRAIEEMMDDNNPERYSQVLTTCRRLWSDIAKQLFDEVFPDYKEKAYTTKSGKEIDVSGDHDNNKLSAVIETLQSKAVENSLVGSETIYLIDWIEQISNRQSAGVHSEVTREQARQCIIHTYIALGDILTLKNSINPDSIGSEASEN